MTGTMRKRRMNVWEITVSLGKDEHGIRRRRSKTVYGAKSEAPKRLRRFVEEVRAESAQAERGAGGRLVARLAPRGCATAASG